MANFSKEFLEKTVKVWQPYSPAPLTLDNAREIAQNMTDLVLLLAELEQKYGKEEKKI